MALTVGISLTVFYCQKQKNGEDGGHFGDKMGEQQKVGERERE